MQTKPQVFEEIITLASGNKVTVYCRGIEEFKSLLSCIIEENTVRANNGFVNMHEIADGRIMQRIGRNGMTYSDFRSVYF